MPIILPPSRELILLPIIARKGGSLKNLSLSAKESRRGSLHAWQRMQIGAGIKLLFHALAKPQSDSIYGAADCKSCFLHLAPALIKLRVHHSVILTIGGSSVEWARQTEKYWRSAPPAEDYVRTTHMHQGAFFAICSKYCCPIAAQIYSTLFDFWLSKASEKGRVWYRRL